MPFFGHRKGTKVRYHIDVWIVMFPLELPICNVCKNELKIKAKSSVSNSTTHFYHENNTNCSTIDENRKRYEELIPTEKDYENAKYIRHLTSDHLDKVYLKCKFLLDNNLSHSEFKNMLKKANEKNIWLYKGLTFKYVPYVLLVNNGLFKDKKRFFVFESNFSNYDDLWNQQKHISNKIWRVEMSSNDIEEFIMYDDLVMKKYFFNYRSLLT